MQEVYELLKRAGTYFLATDEGGQPHVRPFGTADLYRGRLYFLTGKSKAVSRQLHANPRLELCAMTESGWLRVEGSAVVDDDREARVFILTAHPNLQSVYSPDDGNTEVWYLRNCTAILYSFTEPPKTWRF